MSDTIFLTALKEITSGSLAIGGLIDAANRLSRAGQIEQARQLYKIWINYNQDNPHRFIAHFNGSSLDGQVGDNTAAIEHLKQAIAVNPDFVPAYINLGGILERGGNAEGALSLWKTASERTLHISGENVSYVNTALRQMARVCADRQHPDMAEDIVRQCLDIDPHQYDIIEQYVAFRLANCNWPIVVPRERLDRRTIVLNIHPLSLAVYTDDPLLQLAAADRYVRKSSLDKVYLPTIDRRNASIDMHGRRMRIGYISSDLRDHAIGYLMAEMFELHRKDSVEVFAYYCGPESSNSVLTKRTKAAVEHWVDIRGMSDDDAAQQIAADGIDILVDVNGHTRDSRTGVFARRPAPIQVNWLGYPGTMGTPYHQYIIADDWIIPEGSELHYSENVLRLPCYQPNDRKRVVASETPTRAEAGLPDNAFVFCCFNGTHKIGRSTFDRWMDILNQVKNSVLWLLDTTAATKDRLGAYAETKGISRDRLVFAPKQHNPMHLARYKLADLFLDTFPYGAHTTASDALWMGIPVLTLSGRSFASRVCGSLVRSAGLGDLVCTRPDDYVGRAIALANAPVKLAFYKKKLEEGRDSCVLFNMDLLVERLEDLYRQMCVAHSQGETPVPDLHNLDAYLEAGLDHDHEAVEMIDIQNYIAHYKEKLGRLHMARPLPEDNRIWTAHDIAAIENRADTPRSTPQKRGVVQPKQRKTGTK